MRFKILVFFIFIFHSYYLSAQVNNYDSLTSLVYKNAYQLIDDYELTSHFKNDTDYTRFHKLFRNKTSMIFNDIMPDNNLNQKISVQDYTNLSKKYYSSRMGISIIPYDKSTISFDRDNYGSFVFHAQKIIDAYTRQGIHYNDTFNIRIEIFFNHQLNKYWIADIHSLDKNEKYMIVQPFVNSAFTSKNITNDTVLTSAGEKFAVEPNGYFLIKDVPPSKEFVFIPQSNQILYNRYRSPVYLSIIKRKNDIDNNIVPIKFWKWTVHADLSTEFGILKNSPVNIVDNPYKINVINRLSVSNKILINLMYRNSNAGNWQIKFGAGFDIFNYDLYMPKYIDSYPEVDPDGDAYLRIIELNNLHEFNSLTYLTFPIILQKGFTFNKSTISVNAAYYFMMSYAGTYLSKTKAQYSGFYDYLFNLTISENGVYDFGAYNLRAIAIPLLTNSNLNAFGFGLEYSYSLSRFISINSGFNYRKSIDYLFQSNKSSLSKTSNELKSVSNISNTFQIRYTSMYFGLTIKI
jgi:hypothetical protein